MENSIEVIINLFYIEHLKVKDIAQKLKVSSAYITKVVKQNSQYEQEKAFRKELSRSKRKLDQNSFIKAKREKKKIEDNFAILNVQHNQAVCELSEKSHLTNEDYRKWNSSVYKYNPSKRRYEYDESLVRSYAVPKYIKERKF